MKNRITLVIVLRVTLLVLCLSVVSAKAASLVPDPQFRAPLFAEPNPAVRTLLLPDGNCLLFLSTDTLTDRRTGAITRYLPNGELDTSFSFSRDYKFVGAAASASDGQLIITAIQYTYDGNSGTEQLLRLNTDGSIDSAFNASVIHPDPYTTVRSIVVQPDGKILVVGSFSNFGEVPPGNIVRLLADGTVDPTFNPPQLGNWYSGIYPKPVLLADGKILIAGDFGSVDGVTNLGVARLNSDGSVDITFQASGFIRYSASTAIRGIVATSDGKILIAGRFRVGTGGTAPRVPLLRLNADGSLDTSYLLTAFGPSDSARDLVLQPDDKAVAVLGNSVYRVDPSGLRDTSFTPPSFIDVSYSPDGYAGFPNTLSLQPDGRMIVAGTFTDVNPPGVPGDSHFGMVRLNSDGTVDSAFVTNHRTGFEDSPSSFARLPDGSVLTSFRIFSRRHEPAMAFNLGRLLPDGSVDATFTLSSSDPGGILSTGFTANDFVQLVDGQFFVHSQYGGGAKFRSDGVQDLGFQLDVSAQSFQKATNAPDGRVLLSAGTDPSATVIATLSRIQRNGSRDAGFQLPPSINSSQVIRIGDFLNGLYVGSHVLAVQPNGKILFLYFSSDKLFHFIRLNADGSVDDSFSSLELAPLNLTFDYPVVFDPIQGGLVQPPGGAWSATAPLRDAHILPDGRILLCGQFTSYNGFPARGLVRLQSNGTVDDTFTIGDGAQWVTTTETPSFFPFVEALEEQVDGRLLVAGTFEAFNGTILPGIASLNPNGSVDASFTPPAKRHKFTYGTTSLMRQADGSFLLSGPYSFPNESEPAFIHIYSFGDIPVVGSPPQATAVIGQPFSYQIEASGQPSKYSASGLPPGFTIDPETGVITGTPTPENIGIYVILLTATNEEGTSNIFYLTLTVIPSQIGPLPRLQNISTRLNVLPGDNALIGGFIITGSTPRRVIVRAIGPSLANIGISGALADPVLELHGPGGFVTITNDNWRDTQQSEIEATGIPPGHDMESAIVATLPAGPYTAVLRGVNDATGVGLVEVYDLDATADAQLANISTRGFVDAGVNVMIGGLIAGPTSAGSSRMLIRAIGPSLTNLGVPNALPDPSLELHDVNGALIASNNNWRDTQESAIEATGIAPTDDNESAIIWVLAPGSYTAVVQGAHLETGVGLVEVYNLQ